MLATASGRSGATNDTVPCVTHFHRCPTTEKFWQGSASPSDTRVFLCHDYQPGGRELIIETTIGEQKRNNVMIKADKELNFILTHTCDRKTDYNILKAEIIDSSLKIYKISGI